MENIKFKLKNFVESKKFDRTLKVIGIFVVVFFVFQTGIFIGVRKGSFMCNWGDNYRKNFGAPRDTFRGMIKRDISGAHGVIGKVVDISLPSVFIAGDDGIEKVVLVGEKTIIRKFRNNILANEISVDDNVVVVGSPKKDGTIAATLIRVMPVVAPAETASTTQE